MTTDTTPARSAEIDALIMDIQRYESRLADFREQLAAVKAQITDLNRTLHRRRMDLVNLTKGA